jgi:hypothetical protein
MPKQSGTLAAFARVEAKLRREIGALEAALKRTQEKHRGAAARLEELLRVRGLVTGAAPAQKKARPPKSGTAVARVQPTAEGSLPEAGTAARAVLDAIRAGLGQIKEISKKTGFGSSKVGGLLTFLLKRGLVIRSGTGEFVPGPALEKGKKK